MRPESHEIDTLARRQVPRALPSAWEHRELVGRDYGIDMMVELFQQGEPIGNQLALQIKGKSSPIEQDGEITFDMPVRTLRYAETTSVPLILAVCPVMVEPPKFFYVWLQTYIRVILDFDNPGWRDNRSSARIKIPADNKMPGTEGKLLFIANKTRRDAEWTQLARILDSLKYLLDGPQEFVPQRATEIRSLFCEAQELRSIFDAHWHWGKWVRQTFVDTAIQCIDILVQPPYNYKEVFSAVELESRFADRVDDQQTLQFFLVSHINHCADSLSAYHSMANDYQHARILWEHERSHDF
jgi:hypothetical protein